MPRSFEAVCKKFPAHSNYSKKFLVLNLASETALVVQNYNDQLTFRKKDPAIIRENFSTLGNIFINITNSW